ncbi:MAG: 3-oxoacyl-ACP reductase [Proteobacteria bacterium]|nr:3-oxoacyl-ACP reductase [Pseudomonadota bacterium]MCP4918752.1 3-oxoacyl-ACP reductase [Pseudomonadota bacterium]
MADRIVALSGNPTARKFASQLGVSLPPVLKRDSEAWAEQPLAGKSVLVLGTTGAELTAPLATALARSGAEPVVDGDLAGFAEAGEAWGRPPKAAGDEEKVDVIVFDATGIRDIAGLKALHGAMQPRLKGLQKSGRVLVLSRPHKDVAGIEASATQRALDGFTRSLAKEVGRKGSTANLLVVKEGAEDRLEPVLRWFASPRSAFISGQPVVVSKTVRRAEDKARRPLDGKVVVVTGSARGIGAATAATMAREGAKVVVLDHPSADAQAAEVAAKIGGKPLLLDVTEPDAGEQIVAFAQEHFGGLDVVVHNAGVTRDKTLARMKEEHWDFVLGVNLAAILKMNEAIVPALGKNGRLVFLSSIGGIGGNVGQTNYAASKAGVIGIVDTMSARLARKGIAVNAVAPGFIETRMTAAIPVATREVARRLSNVSQGGLPQDVAETITFLASPGAHGLCGQVVRVCGGNLLGA